MGHTLPKSFKLKMRSQVISGYRLLIKHTTEAKFLLCLMWTITRSKTSLSCDLHSIPKFSKMKQIIGSKNLVSNLFMNTNMIKENRSH